MAKSPLVKSVLKVIQSQGLVRTGETLVVGVSGGPDSVCLLHLLRELQEPLEIRLHVAHLNHGLRGSEADADAEYVAELARSLGLPATIQRQDVAAYRERHGGSLEEAAREVRYGFFARVAQSLGGDRVAVGHTADDQVETLLLHLIRGAGLEGLRGMAPLSLWRSRDSSARVMVVRPLLGVRRCQTLGYCAAQGLAPREDSSNREPWARRNRIRSELLPLLRRYNPQIDAALLATARSATDELAFFQGKVLELWKGLVRETPGGISLDTKLVAQLPPALQRHLLREVVRRWWGDLRSLESSHVEAMMGVLARPGGGKQVSLPEGLTFSADYRHAFLGPGEAPQDLPPLSGKHPLAIPGETLIPGWRVMASLLPAQAERGSGGFPGSSAEGWKAYLDAEVAGPRLWVRPRRPGDSFYPLGMAHPKKLQEFMVDEKIPRALRGRVPLVCSPAGILWVVGWRLDDRAKITLRTRQVLHLEFQPG
jgi:tRNA(Ile)-lysidine synthase